mmetsp:Transcript_3892/g.12081  ORF Transcript_3892/g.12081 Transcript_3892/m.12081 type:complete len:215 (-) Transcript_3892:999-1643(-)
MDKSSRLARARAPPIRAAWRFTASRRPTGCSLATIWLAPPAIDWAGRYLLEKTATWCWRARRVGTTRVTTCSAGRSGNRSSTSMDRLSPLPRTRRCSRLETVGRAAWACTTCTRALCARPRLLHFFRRRRHQAFLPRRVSCPLLDRVQCPRIRPRPRRCRRERQRQRLRGRPRLLPRRLRRRRRRRRPRRRWFRFRFRHMHLAPSFAQSSPRSM